MGPEDAAGAARCGARVECVGSSGAKEEVVGRNGAKVDAEAIGFGMAGGGETVC